MLLAGCVRLLAPAKVKSARQRRAAWWLGGGSALLMCGAAGCGGCWSGRPSGPDMVVIFSWLGAACLAVAGLGLVGFGDMEMLSYGDTKVGQGRQNRLMGGGADALYSGRKSYLFYGTGDGSRRHFLHGGVVEEYPVTLGALFPDENLDRRWRLSRRLYFVGSIDRFGRHDVVVKRTTSRDASLWFFHAAKSRCTSLGCNARHGLCFQV